MYSSGEEECYDSEEWTQERHREWKENIRARLEAQGVYAPWSVPDRRPLIDRVTNQWQNEPDDFSEKYVTYQYQDRRLPGARPARGCLEWTEQKMVDILDLDATVIP